MGQFAADPAIRGRVTLLQGTDKEIVPELRQLGFEKTTRFVRVFTSAEDLLTNRAAFPRAPLPLQSQQIPPPVHGHLSHNAQPKSMGPVLVNAFGNRIDKQLDIDVSARHRLSQLVPQLICFPFGLLGKCEAQPCTRMHLKDSMQLPFEHIWYVSRQHSCPSGQNCKNPRCIYSHEDGHPLGTAVIGDPGTLIYNANDGTTSQGGGYLGSL